MELQMQWQWNDVVHQTKLQFDEKNYIITRIKASNHHRKESKEMI